MEDNVKSTQQIERAIKFYLLATKLKEIVRSGWKIWHVKKERLESVAERIYGTCTLAIAIDSEFQMKVNLEKSLTMIILHELEEIVIGDLTPFDKIVEEQSRIEGYKAVQKVLACLSKKDTYIKLLHEFEECKTSEAKFARMCDKLECDMYVKILCEKGYVDLFAKENICLVDKLKKLGKLDGSLVLSDLFIENDKKYFLDDRMKAILTYVKSNSITKLEAT